MKKILLTILPLLLIVGCLKTPPPEQITKIYGNVLVVLLISWTITLKKGAVVFSMKKLILITTLSSIAFSNPQPTIECKNGVLDTLSMAKVTDSMSEEKKKEFSDAYMALVFSRFDFDKSEEVLELELCQIMSGRTAIEIIEIASQIPDEQNEIIFGKFLAESFDKAGEERESSAPEDKKIKEIHSWYVGDVWNEIVDFSWFLSQGTSSTGGDIDIDFTLRKWNKTLEQLDTNNKIINNLKGKRYEDIKYAWNKMYPEILKINNWIQTHKIKANYEGEEFSTDLLKQYHNYFREVVDAIEAKRDINK